MTAILLVEDEEAIKQKIMNNVPWNEHGFEPVYSASNGLEALAVLEQHPVAIMVTDIQMPKMNGIELIKAVKQRNYPMKIIVISGFAEFEYAQESIKLNVSDYLLKPFASRKLLEVVLRLQQEIEKEQADTLEVNELRQQLCQNMAALQEKFFIDLLRGSFGAGTIQAQLEFLGLTDLENRCYQLVVIEIPESQLCALTEEEKHLLNLQFVQKIQKLMGENGYRHLTINYQRNRVVIIIFDPDPDLPMRMEEMLVQMRLVVNHSLACGMSHFYSELTDLAIGYKEADTALQYRYQYGLNQVFSINDLTLDNPSYHKMFYTLHRNPIFDKLKIGTDHTIQEDLKKLIDEMRQSRMSPELSKIMASNLILLAFTTLNELGYSAVKIFGADYSALADVSRVESLDEMEKLLVSFFERIHGHICQKRTSLNHQLIEEIRQYIDDNFTNDITLSRMANQYKISPSYLSLLFVERAGKNFIDYLTEHRIQKAKELLKHTDMKIYEISNAVGYNDSFYFSNCFKKLVGVSPSEYRETLVKE